MFANLKALFHRQAAGSHSCHYAGDHWPFDQPRNCATMTMRQVLDGSEPILLDSHNAADHGWQFIGSTDARVKDARLVCFEAMVARDPSVFQLADLPPGWRAVRRSPKHPWERHQSPPDDDTFDQDREV